MRIVARNVVVVDLGHTAVGDLYGYEPENGFALPGHEPGMRARSPERVVVVLRSTLRRMTNGATSV